MTRHQHQSHRRQDGFTIVETMIALAVLSTILLMATVIMISIGNLYKKGITQSGIQDDARSVTDQVAQDIKLNAGPVSTGSGTITGTSITANAICIGSAVRYSYVVGYRLGSGSEPYNPAIPLVAHVLWRNDGSSTADLASSQTNPACQAVNLGTISSSVDPSGSELIAANSRLTDFNIAPVPGTSAYGLAIGVAYGDYDLLSNLTPGSNSPTATCNGNTGDQFCATAIQNTTVIPR